MLGVDRLQVLVDRALGDDDDALALADLAVLLKHVAHLRLPVVGQRRSLRHEDVVGATADAGHEREPAAVTAHDLDDEGARVRRRGRVDAVDGLADPVQRCRCADRQISAGHVVVDLRE